MCLCQIFLSVRGLTTDSEDYYEKKFLILVSELFNCLFMDFLEFAKIYGKNFLKVGVVTGVIVFMLLRLFVPPASGDMALGFQFFFHVIAGVISMFVASTAYTLYNRKDYLD